VMREADPSSSVATESNKAPPPHQKFSQNWSRVWLLFFSTFYLYNIFSLWPSQPYKSVYNIFLSEQIWCTNQRIEEHTLKACWMLKNLFTWCWNLLKLYETGELNMARSKRKACMSRVQELAPPGDGWGRAGAMSRVQELARPQVMDEDAWERTDNFRINTQSTEKL
jgi:hypothetical protein